MTKLITNIVDISFRGRAIMTWVEDNLEIGNKLFLKAEPDNQYDANAVQVWITPPNGDDLFLGFIPKKDNFEIAQHLARGGEATCVVMSLGKAPQIVVEYEELADTEEADEYDDGYGDDEPGED